VGILGITHHLEYNSFDTYHAKDFLELAHAQWHTGLGPYERTVVLPHLRGLVILMLENLKLNSTVTYKADNSLDAVMQECVLCHPKAKIWIHHRERNTDTCVWLGWNHHKYMTQDSSMCGPMASYIVCWAWPQSATHGAMCSTHEGLVDYTHRLNLEENM
jgi:hypothetical protein